VPFVGTDFFPLVDAGQIRLHVRAPAGTRVNRPSKSSPEWKTPYAALIPAGELADILDDIGFPTADSTWPSATAHHRMFDGEILVSLKAGEHGPTWDYVRDCGAS